MTYTTTLPGSVFAVSIPFKRESPFGLSGIGFVFSKDDNFMFQFPSNGKALSDIPHAERLLPFQASFQFPSNGKALSDERDSAHCETGTQSVSIPFKRESPFGHYLMFH